MSDFDVDLFVIGGGSGGVRAARIAAGYGAAVMLAEEYRVGGTCVIRGCVPKKLLVYASRFKDEFEDAAGFGWSVPEARFDWATLIRNKDAEIARLENVYRSNLVSGGVEVLDSRAVIEDAHTVRIAKTGARVRARTILVATGAHPTLEPPIPGGELGVTSNEVFHLERLPERILVIGGGYIAVEFAGIFCGLGSRVTLLHRGDKLLRGFDEDIRSSLGEAYARRGIDLRLGRTVERLERRGDAIAAILSDGAELVVDEVLRGDRPPAEHRRPRARNRRHRGRPRRRDPGRRLLADADALDLRRRRRHEPRQPHPDRDPRGPRLRRHRVRRQADDRRPFADPDRGLLDARDRRHRHERGDGRGCAARSTIYKTSFRAMKATLSGRDERVFMKLIVDAASDKVLGVHIMGEGAGEIIQAVGIAVTMGATKADFDRTIAVHPTASEELVTMRTPFVVKHPQAVG